MSNEVERVIKMDRSPLRRLSPFGHKIVYRVSGGRIGGVLDGTSGRRPVLLLTTTGRRTGRHRTTPLIYLADGGSWVVVGSNAARDSDPGWVHNLRANPDAGVQIGRNRYDVVAAELGSDEAQELWPALDAMYAGYAVYRTYTRRPLPVFRLHPIALPDQQPS